MDTIWAVNTFYRTAEFDSWLSNLKDKIGKSSQSRDIKRAIEMARSLKTE